MTLSLRHSRQPLATPPRASRRRCRVPAQSPAARKPAIRSGTPPTNEALCADPGSTTCRRSGKWPPHRLSCYRRSHRVVLTRQDECRQRRGRLARDCAPSPCQSATPDSAGAMRPHSWLARTCLRGRRAKSACRQPAEDPRKHSTYRVWPTAMSSTDQDADRAGALRQ